MENHDKLRSWSVVRLRNAVAAKVDELAEQTGMERTSIVNEMVMYAMDHVHVGPVTRLGLIFDGEEVKHGKQ